MHVYESRHHDTVREVGVDAARRGTAATRHDAVVVDLQPPGPDHSLER